MRRLLGRLLCRFTGCPDSVIWWEPWRDDPEIGRHRIVTEECVRCRGVLAQRSVVEGGRWTA